MTERVNNAANCRRKYGADKVEEAVLGEQSFAALLHKALSQV